MELTNKPRVYAIPRKDLIVRFPDTLAIMPDKGCYVPWTGKTGTYFKRRLKCNDISIIYILDIVKSDIINGEK